MYSSQLGIRAAAVTGCILFKCALPFGIQFIHSCFKWHLFFGHLYHSMLTWHSRWSVFFKSTKFYLAYPSVKDPIWKVCNDGAPFHKKSLGRCSFQSGPIRSISQLATAQGFQMVWGATLAARHRPVVRSDVPRCSTKLLSKPLETKAIKRCPLRKAFRAALCLLLTRECHPVQTKMLLLQLPHQPVTQTHSAG